MMRIVCVLSFLLIASLPAVAQEPGSGGGCGCRCHRAERVAEKARERRQDIQEKLGIRFSVFESRLRRSIISTRSPWGFKIARVRPGSPAAEAGLKRGHLLMKIDGRPFRRIAQLEERIGQGGVVTFDLARRRKDAGRFSRRPFEDFQVEIDLGRTK